MPVFHALTIVNIRRETDDTVSIAFDVPPDLQAEYRYNAGQYLSMMNCGWRSRKSRAVYFQALPTRN